MSWSWAWVHCPPEVRKPAKPNRELRRMLNHVDYPAACWSRFVFPAPVTGSVVREALWRIVFHFTGRSVFKL